MADFVNPDQSDFWSRYQCAVRRGTGNGSYSSVTLYNLSAAGPVCVAVTAMGEGDGSFGGPAYCSVGAGLGELCAADLDEDADLAVPCCRR